MKFVFVLVSGMVLLLSCNKTDFLDKKPSSDLVVPTTLADFQALLDNYIVMSETPELGELSADNYYLSLGFWDNLDAEEHNAYIWAPDIYQGQGNVADWNLPYQQVFYANVALQGLLGMTVSDSSDQQKLRALEGAAYFIRAYAFYNIAQVFAPVYDSTSAITDPGIPIRLTADVNAGNTRANMQQTYMRIIGDLQLAYSLLPVQIPVANLNRPSKPAALAMLARVYLSMRAYGQAGQYADSCLKIYGALLNYNTISRTSRFPFTSSNPEVLYQSHLLSTSGVLVGLIYPSCVVDSVLYRSYADSDLRKTLFFLINGAGQPNIKGSYNTLIYPFTGLATDEVYLIRAECYARSGDTVRAISDLNTLLQNRLVTGSFVSYTGGSTTAVLDMVLTERRKELAFRGLRWTDLRRLNKDGANITLTRVLDKTDTLPPNDPRYVLPIPPDVSGIAQNPR